MVGAAGKNRVFKHFLPDFCPVWCVSSICIHMFRKFWKEIGPSWLFLAVGTTDTKDRRSTGVATANSTNKYPNANQLSSAINYHSYLCLAVCWVPWVDCDPEGAVAPGFVIIWVLYGFHMGLYGFIWVNMVLYGFYMGICVLYGFYMSFL